MFAINARHICLAIALFGAVFCAAFAYPGIARTMQRRFPTPPPSAQDDADKKEQTSTNTQTARKAQLAQAEKEFREGVDRLYQLSNEVHEEVQKTPATGVLSVSMYKKMEAIEKLAKNLKNKAKGG